MEVRKSTHHSFAGHEGTFQTVIDTLGPLPCSYNDSLYVLVKQDYAMRCSDGCEICRCSKVYAFEIW